MLCGTEPFPELYRAKKYKIHQKFLTKTDFQFIMRNLPVKVADKDIDEMFSVADADNDGKIGYKVSYHLKNRFNQEIKIFIVGLPEDGKPTQTSRETKTHQSRVQT